MASEDNTATAAAHQMSEENVAADVATATTAAMAPAAATAPATATTATTASANDVEASSSQAAADLAVTFPLPSLAAAFQSNGNSNAPLRWQSRCPRCGSARRGGMQRGGSDT